MTEPADKPLTSRQMLARFIARIERAEAEAKAARSDVTAIYNEAATSGFNKALLKETIKLRKLPPDQRANANAELEIYLGAMDAAPSEKPDDASAGAQPASHTGAPA